jgi:6-phosphogluconolactonase/glucosamine-6-phosphate isomerase/deaminase
MEVKIGKLLVLRYKNKKDALISLAKDLESALSMGKDKNISLLLLLSGGSSFEALEFISKNVLGNNITIAVLDERYDPTNKNNNFSQLKKLSFFNKANSAGCHFIDTSVKKEQSQKELTEYFENSLREWKNDNPGGIIFATVGIGADGHSSGIMPHKYPQEENEFYKLFDSKKWVCAYDAKDKNKFSERVTTTNTFLRLINKVFIFISGKEKKKAFMKFKKDGIYVEVPARILKEINGAIYTTNNIID